MCVSCSEWIFLSLKTIGNGPSLSPASLRSETDGNFGKDLLLCPSHKRFSQFLSSWQFKGLKSSNSDKHFGHLIPVMKPLFLCRLWCLIGTISNVQIMVATKPITPWVPSDNWVPFLPHCLTKTRFCWWCSPEVIFFSLHSLHKLLPFNSCDINDNNKQQQLQSVFNTVSALHSLSCCHVYDNPSYEEGSWNYHLRFFRWELRLKEDSELIEEVGFTLGTSWVILHSLSHASTWAQQE